MIPYDGHGEAEQGTFYSESKQKQKQKEPRGEGGDHAWSMCGVEVPTAELRAELVTGLDNRQQFTVTYCSVLLRETAVILQF